MKRQGFIFDLGMLRTRNVATDEPAKYPEIAPLVDGDLSSHLSFLRNYPESKYRGCAIAKRNMLHATQKALNAYVECEYCPPATVNKTWDDLHWAVGIVLHTIQDSFSPCHARRDLYTAGYDLRDMCGNTDWPSGSENANNCMHPTVLPWCDFFNQDFQDAAVLTSRQYLATVNGLSKLRTVKKPQYQKEDDISKQTEAFLEQYFKCFPFADGDSDGYLDEADLEIVPKSKGGLDCDDTRASIGDCKGKCDDMDADVIPDGCDPCPLAPDPQFAGSNVIDPGSGKDGDKDGVLDECDLCPAYGPVSLPTFEQGGFFDKDVDGVANACDNCASANPVLACKSDADCPVASKQRCIASSSLVQFGACSGSTATGRRSCSNSTYSYICTCTEVGQWGRCAVQGDLDLDGRGDACDACPNVASTDTTNSNSQAEGWSQVAERFDTCDGVPAFRLERQKVHMLPPIFPDPPLIYPDSPYFKIEDVVGSSWIGKTHPDDADPYFEPVEPFQKPIRFGHCSCYDADGFETPFADCTKAPMGQCDPTTLRSGASPWTTPSIRLPGNNPPLPVEGGAPQTFALLQAGPSQMFTWDWDADVRSGKIAGKLTPGSGPLPFAQSHGVIGSYVLDKTGSKSLRDLWKPGLRTIVTRYNTPNVVQGLPPNPSAGFLWFECKVMGCQITLRPWEQYTDPPDWRDPIAEIWDPVILTWADRHVAVRGPGVSADTDITDRVSPAVRDMLAQTGQWAWLLPSEPVGLLEEHRIAQQWAALPVGTNPASDLVTVGVSGGTIVRTDHRIDDGLEKAQSKASSASQSMPRARLPDGGQALFSAIERAVLLIGGKVDGTPAKSIRRYDLASKEWSTVNAAAVHQPRDRVLAAALDVPRRRLFVLDIVDSDKPCGPGRAKKARLVVHRLDDATSQVLFTVPYVMRHASVHLAVGEDGHPILVASTHNHHFAWKIDAQGNNPLVRGVIWGQGAAMDAPMQGRRGPLAVSRWSGFVARSARLPAARPTARARAGGAAPGRARSGRTASSSRRESRARHSRT
jgi:hypothetical protein